MDRRQRGKWVGSGGLQTPSPSRFASFSFASFLVPTRLISTPKRIFEFSLISFIVHECDPLTDPHLSSQGCPSLESKLSRPPLLSGEKVPRRPMIVVVCMDSGGSTILQYNLSRVKADRHLFRFWRALLPCPPVEVDSGISGQNRFLQCWWTVSAGKMEVAKGSKAKID